MAEPASERANGFRELAERLALASVGAVALTAERADALADELARRGAMRREDARAVIEETANRWRGDAVRVSERTGVGLQLVFHSLGLVTRDELDDLELRIAQLEHRLRLVEGTLDDAELPLTRHAREQRD